MTAEHAHGIDTGGELERTWPRYFASGGWRNKEGSPYLGPSTPPVGPPPTGRGSTSGSPETITRASAADAVLAEARRLCCGNNPSAHHEASAKHSELMAFAGDLARAVRGLPRG